MSEPATEEEFAWDEYRADLMPICAVKAEEFHFLGYTEVTPKEILECAHSMLKGRGSLHQAVASILSLNVGQFMNYMTINAYKGNIGEGLV